MLSKVVRQDEDCPPKKKLKSLDFTTEWKLWLMVNYEFEDAAITPIQDILHLAEQYKEKIPGQALTSISLGIIIHDVWSGAVRRMKRGPRKKRQNVYLNLKRSETAFTISHENNDVACRPLSDELAGLAVPDEWKILYDKPNCACFVRPEKWEFNNVRATTEMVVTKSAASPASIFIKVKAHGCEKDLSNIFCLVPLSSKKRVILALDFIDKSSFCTGISLSQGESIQVSVPHITGPFKDLVNEGQEYVKTFSSKCKMFSAPGSLCAECTKLLRVNKYKEKRRKEKLARESSPDHDEVKKSAEPRKRVLQPQRKQKEGADSVPFTEILKDRTAGKVNSHGRLLRFVKKNKNPSVLGRVYLKQQLFSLCEAYEVQFRRSDTNETLASILIKAIKKNTSMSFTAPVDDRQFHIVETVPDESHGTARIRLRLSDNATQSD